MDISAVLKNPFDPLPEPPIQWMSSGDVPHAPRRPCNLTVNEKKLAVKNALRYVPVKFHDVLGKEFAMELVKHGHIYAYRFMPNFPLKTLSIHDIPAKSQPGAAIILMILNNLDPEVAQFPQELVTYGGNGQVFSNWLQFRLVVRYLSELTTKQTLVLYSGHPLGLFPSHEDAPRMTITNGMVIPNYSKKSEYDRMFALGVTQYGQMTAGSFCYIGPQGIVHGTTITIMNAGRRYLGVESLKGKVFVTAGLGGMSGAQPKASTIANCICIVAEVHQPALIKRHKQGWLDKWSTDLNEIIDWVRDARNKQEVVSIGYAGNVVHLWERLADEPEHLADLGSDQTSLHNPYLGGYYPVDLTVEESNVLMTEDPEKFKNCVQQSLRRHIAAIDNLAVRGMYFWDYGNAFLVECERAGVSMLAKDAQDDKTFRYPSYMQDIMGDIFSMGFGPFRWVCSSNNPEDLKKTDDIAVNVCRRLCKQENIPTWVRQQYEDNGKWINEAQKNKLVVGSQARILYSDQVGRSEIAQSFNEAVAKGELQGPVIISRDHHDVSGTDSPFRETSNISDGSAFCADMAVQNVIGDAARGATWVSLHNGGGVGWGDVINGGFGMLLDGSEEASRRASNMLAWDVSNGVTRRCWSGNEKAYEAISRTQLMNEGLVVTLPHKASDALLDQLF